MCAGGGGNSRLGANQERKTAILRKDFSFLVPAQQALFESLASAYARRSPEIRAVMIFDNLVVG
jgi:hypothetical protein